VEHGDGRARDDSGHDDRLAQVAVAGLAERQQQALEERGGLVGGLLERAEEGEVQAPVGQDVSAHAGQQHQVEEPLRHLGVQVGREQPRGLEGGVRRPRLRRRQVQHFFPVGQRRDDLERLGHLAALVAGQQRAHAAVHLHHARVHVRRNGRVVVAVAPVCRRASAAQALHDQVSQRARAAGRGRHERRQRALILLSNLL
jgi:hypothetical protein